MDMPPPRPAVDLSAARQRAVVGERQRGVLDDAPLTLVPIVLDRVREIDQDMPRPLREVVAMHPAALGGREFGKHARFELRSIIAGLGDFFGIKLAITLVRIIDRSGGELKLLPRRNKQYDTNVAEPRPERSGVRHRWGN